MSVRSATTTLSDSCKMSKPELSELIGAEKSLRLNLLLFFDLRSAASKHPAPT